MRRTGTATCLPNIFFYSLDCKLVSLYIILWQIREPVYTELEAGHFQFLSHTGFNFAFRNQDITSKWHVLAIKEPQFNMAKNERNKHKKKFCGDSLNLSATFRWSQFCCYRTVIQAPPKHKKFSAWYFAQCLRSVK
jgi:hypothetical protein